MPRRRTAQWLALVVTALLPLVAWPGIAQPFSTPKRWLLVAGSLAVGALAWGTPSSVRSQRPIVRVLRALPFIWLASWAAPSVFGEVVSFDALLTGIAGGLWGLALFACRLRPRDMALALVASGTAIGAIALAQWAGVDPFRAFGWEPAIQGASVRMRVYATLGNPNFVGAFLAAVMPLTAALAIPDRPGAGRYVAAIALALQCVAVFATGSRGAALASVAAALVWAAIGLRRTLVVAGAIVLAVSVALLSDARPFADTLRGRFHVWSVIAPHASTHPLVGFGPGSTEVRFADWARARPSAGLTIEGAGPEATFQHADNDYLEALVERGVPGLAAVLLVLIVPLVAAADAGAKGGRNALATGAAGAIAAIATVAIVDEPLARPAELMLLWSAVAIIEAMQDADPV